MIRESRPRSGVVLIHGGCHTAACWDQTQPFLSWPSVAVDLPGRVTSHHTSAKSGLLGAAAAVVEDINAAQFGEVVLVAHSMGGTIIPGIVELTDVKICHLVFIACPIPRDGRTLVGDLPAAARWYAQRKTAHGTLQPSQRMARLLFANDLDRRAAAKLVASLVPEDAAMVNEPVNWDRTRGFPITYIAMLRDHLLPHKIQRRYAQRLGDVDLVGIYGGHDGIISQHRMVATVLNGIAATALEKSG